MAVLNITIDYKVMQCIFLFVICLNIGYIFIPYKADFGLCDVTAVDCKLENESGF